MDATIEKSLPFPPEIPRELLGVIVDKCFNGAIEDCAVIEDIYRVIAAEFNDGKYRLHAGAAAIIALDDSGDELQVSCKFNRPVGMKIKPTYAQAVAIQCLKFIGRLNDDGGDCNE